MIPFLIICAAVIAAIVAGYYIWLYWPGEFVVEGKKSIGHYDAIPAEISNRRELHEVLDSMWNNPFYRKRYIQINAYRYRKSTDGLKLIKTIKWSQ